MKSASLLALVSLFGAIGPSSTLGAEHVRRRELALDSVTCAAVTCPIDSPICVIGKNGEAACIEDPCVNIKCDKDSVCQVDDIGNANCVTYNPCWAVRCSAEFPTCVVVDGLAQCVEDVCANFICADGEVCFAQEVQCIRAPCPPIATCIPNNPCAELICNAASTCEVDEAGKAFCQPLPGNPGNPIDDPCAELICNAASTCEVDEAGKAFCQPLPGNPGNPIDDVTCANVRCPGDAPFCTILADGTAECSAEVPIKGGAAAAPQAWWELVKKNFTGEDLARCGKRKNVAPADGAKCSKKKRKNKTCFFGSQECASVGAFPDTRCKCTDGKWKCDSGIACPSNANDELN